MFGRVLLSLALLALGAAFCVALYVRGDLAPRPVTTRSVVSTTVTVVSERTANAHPPAPATDDCDRAGAPAGATASNGATLTDAQWAVFGRPETGWAPYAALAAHEIGTACRPTQAGFAKALGAWQAAHGLQATGAMSAETLRAMDMVWLGRRPFVVATRQGDCPAPPAADLLAQARPDEGYLGKPVELRVEALAAYRRMVAAARAALPRPAADPRILTLVSGFRGPDEEAARCAASSSCGTASMARCSAHRTGMAIDVFLGDRPGFTPTSSDDANRTALSQSPSYLWLVDNAGAFGFTPYPFEPWHWEYTRGGTGGGA